MLVTLAFAILLGGSRPALDTPEDSVLVGLVEQACVATGLQRDAFEQAARTQRWRPAPLTRNTGEGWSLAYRTGQATITLSGLPVDGVTDPSLGSMCMVAVHRPDAGWREQLSALAVELGMQEDPALEIPGAPDVRSWSKFGGHTLTAAYQPANQTVAVTLSRQIVVGAHEISPSGN